MTLGNNMKTIIAIIYLATLSYSAAEKPPAIAISHIEAIKRNQSAKLLKLVEEWPNHFAMLKKKLDKKIKTKEDHQRLLASIPKKFLKGYKIGSTIETKEWILTSLDPSNSEMKESLWIMVVATKKGGDYVYASSSW